MSDQTAARRPVPATLIGGVLTTVGLFLAATVDMGFMILAGLGTFGPGLLRELGWLHDQDEFRRLAAWRAGYQAYLAGGIAAVLVIAVSRTGTASIEGAALGATIVLCVLWLVWFFAAVLRFWGTRRAVSRTLLVYGVFWLLFNILGNLTSPMAMFMQCLVAVPFLSMAWLTYRWPRVTGVLLLLFGAASIVFFNVYEVVTERRASAAIVFVILSLPLLAGGVALLRSGSSEE